MSNNEITSANVHTKVYKTEKGALTLHEKMMKQYPEKNFSVNKIDDKTFNVIVSQVPRDVKRKSDIENPCHYVWSTASELFKQGFKRGQIIQQCIDDGVAFHTARTQYQLWFTAHKASQNR